jgi:hypothetical protein
MLKRLLQQAVFGKPGTGLRMEGFDGSGAEMPFKLV